MPDIVAAADEAAANSLIQTATSSLGTLNRSGSGTLGPFNASWNASAHFQNGTVDLIVPDIVRVADLELHYTVGFTFSFDLSSIIPDFCLPRVCVWTPWGDVCTPRICVDWPTVTIPVSHTDWVKFTGDFRLVVSPTATHWLIDVVIVGVPLLQIGPASAVILAAIGLAAALILAPIPFIGPILAIAVAGITAAIAVAGVTGLLGPILSLFVAGLRFNIYEQPKQLQVLPAGGPSDPAVFINLDSVGALVDGSAGEDELVISVDVSP